MNSSSKSASCTRHHLLLSHTTSVVHSKLPIASSHCSMVKINSRERSKSLRKSMLPNCVRSSSTLMNEDYGSKCDQTKYETRCIRARRPGAVFRRDHLHRETGNTVQQDLHGVGHLQEC